MATGEERTVDEKGRVTIPKSMRDALGLEPGAEVTLAVEDGRVVVRPKLSREAFVETMKGCIDEETRRADAEEVDPLGLKETWTADLPES